MPDEDGAFVWTPCREEVENDPQSEGIVVDQRRGVLYVGFETIGLYKVRLGAAIPWLGGKRLRLIFG